ncbi:MAG: hypothetical protein Q7J15_04465 [Candidatus Desulfaltia sp.]|nr:hypothetical protein [Candidatus Desulfaltia sp.]
MEKEVNCINSRVVINYIKAHNNGDCSELLYGLDPEIDSLSDPESFLKDPNNWISSSVISKLFKKAESILHDERVAYKIAKYSIENSSLGYIQKIFVKAFWSSKKKFRTCPGDQ